MGQARGSLSQLPQQSEQWHQTWQQSAQETANPCLPLFLCQVRGELSGRLSWKVRPSSHC